MDILVKNSVKCAELKRKTTAEFDDLRNILSLLELRIGIIQAIPNGYTKVPLHFLPNLRVCCKRHVIQRNHSCYFVVNRPRNL